MAFICTICNSSLSRIKSNKNSDAILTTFCGHLFHQSCLYKQVAVRRRSQHQYDQPTRLAASTCPTCNRVIEKQKLMQIFPTEAEENNNEIERIVKERNDLEIEIIRLKEELQEYYSNDNTKASLENVNCVNKRDDNEEDNRLSGNILQQRRQIVALQSTRKGFKKGSTVMWLKNEPEEGVVKWIGTIDGVINAGIEFVNPIGNHNFPETSGEQLFACKKNHGRVVPIQDLMHYSEFRGRENDELAVQWEINNNDERQKLEKIREHYQQLVVKSDIWLENFIPKIETMLSNAIIGDTILINRQIESAKALESEILENKSISFAVKDVAKILLESLCVPLYEKCEIDQKLEELKENFESLEAAVTSHINYNLMQALYQAQKCENLINYRTKLLQDFKSRLRNMGKTLIMNDSQLSEQISELSTLQVSFLAQKQEEVSLSELFSTINEFRKYGTDSSRFESATKDIISGHNQLLEDIDAKSSILNRTQLLYRQFVTYTTQFEEWYDSYMEKLAKAPSQASEDRMVYLMQEKEEKRKELVQILNSAKDLRVSIFDSTVLDDKIESLQSKWKILLEKASEHRGRARKTF